tara:strand:+ start:4527 stop:4919 length:393 start_codon:yes stop_codon:yes gene_type:complete
MHDLIKQLEFPFMTIYSISDDILLLEYKESGKIEINDAAEIMNAIEPLNKKGHNLIVSDARVDDFYISKEALDYIAKHPNGRKFNIKNAIVTNSLGLKLLAIVYINFSKPNGPSKIFQNCEEAINWLREN